MIQMIPFVSRREQGRLTASLTTLVRGLLVLTLVATVGTALQKKSPINGTWDVKVGSAVYRITFVEDQGDVSGTVTMPGGESVEIEYGLAIGDELEFSTLEGGVEYEWTAKAGKNSFKGTRLNLVDDSEVAFSAKRAR